VKRAWLATLLGLACAATLEVRGIEAQDVPPGELPEGHPPTGEAPLVEDLPPGHPPTDALPPGHPPMDAPADAPAQGDLPPGHPSTGVDADPHGHGGDPSMDATLERAFREPRVASADPNPSLPAGQIRVTLVDVAGQPVPDHDVQLGIMRQGGDRERTPGRTDASGVFTYTDLPTGSGQAYRVNVPHEGATYSCTPFQLPTAIGYDVRVEVRPTVRSDRSLLLVLGQTMVELRDERLHIIQQARLSNLAPATYLFPEGGTRIELPEGYTAFQTQPVMTNQRVVELAGQGVRIEGSLPTGQVTLAWAFDLPVTGSEMDIEIPNPFRTFQYRVISTAPRGMTLDVEDMPAAVRFEDQGQPLLGTEIQRSPDQAAFSTIHIRLANIPGPSPARLYAVAVAAILLLAGLLLGWRRPTTDRGRAWREARRKELLREAERLEADFAAGELGPETRQSRREAIVRELAVLFYTDERMGTSHAETGADPARASARTPRSGAEGGGKKKKRATARDGRNDESEQPKERARNDESGA
jgi:hypothetical protein